MDRATLNELFDYTTFTWESYRNAVKALPEGALATPVSGSEWPALRNVLFHIAVAWDSWLRDRLGLTDPIEEALEDVGTWSDLQAIRDRTRGWLRRVLDETRDEEMYSRTVQLQSNMQASMADMLSHMLLHERGHHGDVTTLISGLGGTPVGVDYLVYLFFEQRKADTG